MNLTNPDPVAAVQDRFYPVVGHRPPPQKGCYLTCLLLVGLMLLGAPIMHAQTDATNAAPLVPNASPTAPLTSALSAPQPITPQDDIVDIRPPFFFLGTGFWWWIAWGVIGTVALLLLVWLWLKRRRQINPMTAYELTLAKLEKARHLMIEDNPMPYAVLVSETIRTYLGQRFGTPSTRRTTEEFLRLMEADPATPLAEHRLLLLDFLKRCDLVKFARYQPNMDELAMVQQHAISFVIATKPEPTPAPRNGSHP